jgi:flagellar biosynthesis protein FlhG
MKGSGDRLSGRPEKIGRKPARQNSDKNEVSMRRFPKVISVSSGKGGVGKTSLVANLALAFSKMGKRVCVWDADPGSANVEILSGSKGPYLKDWALKKSPRKITEMLIEGPGGILLVPGRLVNPFLADLDGTKKLYLLNELEKLQDRVDILLIDAGTGFSPSVLFFSIAAQEMINVLTPDPSAIASAYSLIKVLAGRHLKKEFSILINQASGEEEALRVFSKLHLMEDRGSGTLSLDYLGFIPYDENISLAWQFKKPVLELFPLCPASQRIRQLADFFAGKPILVKGNENVQFFRNNLLQRGH